VTQDRIRSKQMCLFFYTPFFGGGADGVIAMKTPE
jgi:hypothetical protein